MSEVAAPTLLNVAVAVPLHRAFYYYSIEGKPAPCLGARVLVSFARRKMLGIVIERNLDENALKDDIQLSKIKPIDDILDQVPVLSDNLLALGIWMSAYYHHPIGECLHTMLPAQLRKNTPIVVPAEKFIQACSEYSDTDILQSLQRAKKQLLAFKQLSSQPQSLTQFKQQHSPAVINALVNKGYAEIVLREHDFQAWHEKLNIAPHQQANIDQALAITQVVNSTGFAPFLLDGITGSGKTEVYLQIIDPILRRDQQVLILVPEIGLTPQTVARFEQRFGIEVGVLHSNLSDKARALVWQQAKDGNLGIVIGTRSAIFTPLARPGMIIVDEEHDESFKQQDGLKYHARDLAVYLANQYQIPLVLGSATPSLESLHNAQRGKYHLLQLHQRAGKAVLPSQRLMNIANQTMQYGIAEGMLARIAEHLSVGNQVMIFVNRRGYAPAMLCHHCGYVATCESCDSPFTVHKRLANLQCHRCAETRAIPSTCPQCSSTDFVTEGLGTEQVLQGVQSLFPDYRAVRIDSDAVRGKGKLDKLLADINQHKFDILVGTQILSKGHHFANVTLVLIIDVDSALYSADFRAPEKLAQLVTQLAGRAGRGDKQGEMWLQTHHPEHPLLQDLINNGYRDFAQLSLLERQHAQLPPHHFQLCLRAESNQAALAKDFLQNARAVVEQFQSLSVIGPVPCLIEKRQGRYRYMLVLQSAARQYLQSAFATAMPVIQSLPEAKKVRWSIDVAPIDFS